MADLIDRDALLKDMGLTDAVKYGNKDAEQQYRSYSTWMSYEIADSIWDAPAVNRWIPCSERLPDMRTRVFVVAVRNREHYPKDTEPSRMFIAMRIEMLSDGNWYWASATDIYGYDGIGGMIVLGGWEVVAWMPLPDAYKPPEKE